MEKYYVIRDGENLVLGCGDSLGGEEITKEEYDALLQEVRVKTVLTNNLYDRKITIDDVPTEWQEEIQKRVDDRINAEAEAALQEEE